MSCPSDGLCVAASFDGRIYSSTNPSGGRDAWKIVLLAEEKKPRVHMGGVSCPSPSLCVAVAYSGKVVTSTDPAADKSAWTTTQLERPYDLRGVSCPSVSLCVAVGNEGSVVTSTDPTGGPAAWRQVGTPAGAHSMNGVSCPSPTLCVTGSAGGIVASVNPVVGAWDLVFAGTGLPVKGVSCPTPSACEAIDNNADVIVSTDPLGGPSAWWFKNALTYGFEGPAQGNGMFAISCPLTSLCVAAGQDSQILTSTDPFAPDPQKVPPRRNSKRLRVVITRHPAKRVNYRKGGTRVTFRFHATSKAARFQCKLHGRRFRTCKSPKRYRLNGGKHAFSVRAIAPSGLKGPRTTFHFRVGPLTERPPYGSCDFKQPGGPSAPCVPIG